MTIEEALNADVARMIEAGHQTSWVTGALTRDGEPGQYFVYMTVDAAMAIKAERTLRSAGMLCQTTLHDDRSIMERAGGAAISYPSQMWLFIILIAVAGAAVGWLLK